jgi:hypothetical protein
LRLLVEKHEQHARWYCPYLTTYEPHLFSLKQ